MGYFTAVWSSILSKTGFDWLKSILIGKNNVFGPFRTRIYLSAKNVALKNAPKDVFKRYTLRAVVVRLGP